MTTSAVDRAALDEAIDKARGKAEEAASFADGARFAYRNAGDIGEFELTSLRTNRLVLGIEYLVAQHELDGLLDRRAAQFGVRR